MPKPNDAGDVTEADLEDELRFHLEMQTEANLRAGMTPQQARTEAQRRFGGLEQIKEQCRDQRRFRVLFELWQDVRVGTRTLLKQRGFSAMVVLTLGLAIGANTSIFSVINAVLLTELPYADPEQLVMLWEENPAQGIQGDMVCGPSLTHWREQSRSLDQLGYVANGSPGTRRFVIGDEGDGQWMEGRFASAGFFETLGVAPLLGRTFSEAEDERGSDLVAVLSHACWQRFFAGDPEIVGKSLRVSNGRKRARGIWVWNREFQIVGVMPAQFRFPPATEFWLSYSGHPWYDPQRISHAQWAIARLQPGVSTAQASAELSVIQSRLAKEHPDAPEICTHVKAVPLLQQVNGRGTQAALWILLGAVGVVLLIACANVANLMLVRGTTRQKEIAVRMALGAGRWRVMRQLLTESLLLALAGGFLGLLVAHWGTELLPDFQVDRVASVKEFRMDRFQDVQLDWRVLAFSLGVCLLTSLLVGLVPAWQASSVRIGEVLKEEGRSATGGIGRTRFLRGLLVSEVALAMVLLIGAGLLLQSFWRLKHVDPGVQVESILTANVGIAMAERAYAGNPHLVTRQIVERTRSIPGVVSAAAIGKIPLLKGGSPISVIFDEEAPLQDRTVYPAHRHTVTPGLFRALGIPLLRGRDFTEQDNGQAPPVAIINQTLAERFFGDEDPIGQQLMPHPSGWPLTEWRGAEIIGVVGDVKHFDLRAEASPEVYGCYLQMGPQHWGGGTMVIRTNRKPWELVGALRHEVEGSRYHGKILNELGTIEGLLQDAVAGERYSALLLTLFATVALVLASGGIYGVISYSASQRTRELGIRIALGAQPRHILLLVIGEGLGLSLCGMLLGLGISLVGTRVVRSMLYGIEPTHPPTYIALTGLLMLVALLASYVPVRRALRVDPMVALRHE